MTDLIAEAISKIEEKNEKVIGIFLNNKTLADIKCKAQNSIRFYDYENKTYDVIFGIRVYVNGDITNPFCLGSLGTTVNLFKSHKVEIPTYKNELNKLKFIEKL